MGRVGSIHLINGSILCRSWK